jgi:hypothetical protein
MEAPQLERATPDAARDERATRSRRLRRRALAAAATATLLVSCAYLIRAGLLTPVQQPAFASDLTATPPGLEKWYGEGCKLSDFLSLMPCKREITGESCCAGLRHIMNEGCICR